MSFVYYDVFEFSKKLNSYYALQYAKIMNNFVLCFKTFYS